MIIKLDPLNLSSPEITAASSLINIKERIFLCSDDQYCLYELKSGRWIKHIWSDAPILPTPPLELKKVKPDYEALFMLDDEELVLMPSGSKPNRTLALKFNLKNNSFSPYDLSAFFKSLEAQVQNINIEGAVLVGEKVLLLNRGVQSTPSQIISVNTKTFSIISIALIDFGLMNGVPLHGSEICLYNNSLYSLAVAEDADNSYDDGEIIGSSLVQISLDDYRVKKQWMFESALKAEGLCLYETDKESKWLIATDPDGVGYSDFFTLPLLP